MLLFPDDTNKVLGVSIYSMNPDIANRNIFSDETLSEFKKVSKDICLLVNFVSWEEASVAETVDRVEERDIKILYRINSYDIKGRGLLPCNRMRYDSVSLSEFPYYAFLQENMKIRDSGNSVSGAMQLMHAVHFLAANKRCGVVSLKKTLKGFSPETVIPVPFSVSLSGGAFVVRSMKGISPYGSVIPRRSLELEGAGDDILAASHVLWNGYYPAVLSGFKIASEKVESDGSDSRALMENNNCRFIQDTFNHHYSYTDKGANLVDASVYLEHGGPSVTESYQKMYAMSYKDSKVSAVLDTQAKFVKGSAFS